MSLEVAAKHLAAHGRHGDSTLVHMSPNEVAGLQALAQSKGKSLSRNPHTGLPEAFDLGQELGNVTSGPAATVLGAALNYYFPGLGAMTIGAGVAGTHYVATGGKDVTGSVTGGLGAYGGASVMGNVTGAGTGAIESGSGTAGMTESEAVNASTNAIQNATPYDKLVAGASSIYNNPNAIAALGGYKVLGAAALPFIAGAVKPKAMPTTAQNPQMIRPYTFSYNQQYDPKLSNTPVTTSYIPGQNTAERTWFAPTYVAGEPYKAADGGIIALAAGGPVEQMANNAAIGANTMYPMANMTTSAFATPYQTPQSTNMMATMAPSGGGTVDQMSGEPNMQGTRLAAGGMAAGGVGTGGGNPNDPFDPRIFDTVIAPSQAAKYNYDQNTQRFNQTQAAAPAQTYGTAMVDTMTGAWNEMHPDAAIGNANAPATTPTNFSFNPQTGQFTNQGGPASGYYLDPQTGQYTQRVMAAGGITDLGSYSDGGRLLRGPGDGVSDSIPAQIGNKQPARLADGEFVVPARIVSELGNGSTEAGAKQLYKMLDRVQQARGKTTGKSKVAHNTNAAKYLPA